MKIKKYIEFINESLPAIYTSDLTVQPFSIYTLLADANNSTVSDEDWISDFDNQYDSAIANFQDPKFIENVRKEYAKGEHEWQVFSTEIDHSSGEILNKNEFKRLFNTNQTIQAKFWNSHDDHIEEFGKETWCYYVLKRSFNRYEETEFQKLIGEFVKKTKNPDYIEHLYKFLSDEDKHTVRGIYQSKKFGL